MWDARASSPIRIVNLSRFEMTGRSLTCTYIIRWTGSFSVLVMSIAGAITVIALQGARVLPLVVDTLCHLPVDISGIDIHRLSESQLSVLHAFQAPLHDSYLLPNELNCMTLCCSYGKETCTTLYSTSKVQCLHCD